MSEQVFPLDGFNTLESDVRSITQQTRPKEQKKPQEEQRAWQHFTVILAVEIVVKIKAIARIEGFSIRDVVEKFLSDGIARYEQKHGAVINRKKNIDDIL